MLTDTLAALLRCIVDNPDDLDARLIYAEACEDAGDVDRAEFVRRQIAGELVTLRLSWLVPLEAFLGCQPHQTGRISARNECLVRTQDGKLLVWRNGFVESITCTLQTWLDHGPAIVLRQPIREVVVSDREPEYVSRDPGFDGWRWVHWTRLDYGPSVVPFALYSLTLRGYYPTKDAAKLALSAACVRWARREAALPEWTDAT